MIIRFYIPLSCGKAVRTAELMCCQLGGFTRYVGTGGWCHKPWDDPKPEEEAVVIVEVLADPAKHYGLDAWARNAANEIGTTLAELGEKEFLYAVDFQPFTIDLKELLE
jgi:hypothetical protein